jgi:hypothetical protein
MNSIHPYKLRLLLVASLLTCTSAAWSLSEGKTSQGLAYASGGVSDEELALFDTRRAAFSLWAITAANKSDAQLADVKARIRDAKRQLVFDAPLDGSWLLIDLPLGGYQVETILKDEAHKRSTTIHRGDHHQIVFYFDTGDEVLPSGKTGVKDRVESNEKN